MNVKNAAIGDTEMFSPDMAMSVIAEIVAASISHSKTCPVRMRALIVSSVVAVTIIALVILLTVAYGKEISTRGDIGFTTLTAAPLTVLFGALTVHSGRGDSLR